MTPKAVKYMLIAIFTCQNMSYYLSYFFLADLRGNVFVNGIVFGCAEITSSFVSGYMMQHMKEDVAFRVCAVIAALSTAGLPYVSGGDMMSYFVLFATMIGIGGMQNCAYLIVEMQTAPGEVGKVMQLVYVIAVIFSSAVSLMAALPDPLPILLCGGFAVLAFVLTKFLPEGGQLLPNAVQVNESLTIVDLDEVEYQVEGIVPINSTTAPQFHASFRELAEDKLRPRLS
jgi:hypothetical protein